MIATTDKVSSTSLGTNTSNSELFISKKVSDLFKKVEFFCSKGGSIIFISGEDSCGKTSFSKYLVENLNIKEYEPLLLSIINEQNDSGWLLPKIYQRLGIKEDNISEVSSAISNQLDQLFEEHKNLTVIIDSVDLLMNEKAISDILFLMSIQGVSDSRISFVLLGKKIFLERIRSTEIVNRISYFCEFPRMTQDDIYDYFFFKTKSLGMKSCSLSKEGIDYIYNLTDGKIKDISLILDNCVIEAELNQLKVIEKNNIEDIVSKHILSFRSNLNTNYSVNENNGLNNLETIDYNEDIGSRSRNEVRMEMNNIDQIRSNGDKSDDRMNFDTKNLFSSLDPENNNVVNEENSNIEINLDKETNNDNSGNKEKNINEDMKVSSKDFLDDLFKKEDSNDKKESFMDLIKKS